MVSLDENVRPIEYNYRTEEEIVSRGELYYKLKDLPGFSVFKLEDGKIYHTYSTYGRGPERMNSTYSMLDMTPLGRQDELWARLTSNGIMSVMRRAKAMTG
jgi:predicted dithiol-disulfide oxidoreductase (DUF899 family)